MKGFIRHWYPDISVNVNTFIEIRILGENILRIECNHKKFC